MERLKRVLLGVGVIFFLVFGVIPLYSDKEVTFTLEDRDRLIKIEIKIEELEKRLNLIDKRIDDINRRLDEFRTFMWIFAGVFTSLVITIIGLAFWDRRTILKGFS